MILKDRLLENLGHLDQPADTFRSSVWSANMACTACASFLCVFISLIPLSSVFAEKGDATRQAFDAAMAQARGRKHGKAAEALRQLVRSADKSHPLAADIQFRLAEQYASLRQHETAAKTYELLKDYPAFALQTEATFRAGEQWRDARHFDKAHQAFRDALDKFKDKNPRRWWDCHWRIVDCYRRENKNTEAAAYYKTMLGLEPDVRGQYLIHTGYVDVLRRARRYTEALDGIGRAIEALGDRKGLTRAPYITVREYFLRQKADALRDARKVEEALAEYEKLAGTAEQATLKAWAWFEAAQLLRRRGERGRAHRLYLEAHPLAGGDQRFRARILHEMLWNAREMRKPAMGETAAHRLALVSKADLLGSLSVLERYYCDRNVSRPEALLPLYRKALELDLPVEQKCQIQARLAKALLAAGQVDQAQEELAKLKSQPGAQGDVKRTVQLTEASLYRGLGCLERAAKVYEQHLRDFPAEPDPYALRYLAELKLELGDEARAFELLKKARQVPRFRDHSWVVDKLANLSLALAEYDTARDCMEEILTWRGNDRQKAERQQRAELHQELEETHERAAELPERLKGGKVLSVDFAGRAEFALPIEVGAVGNGAVRKGEDGTDVIVPTGEGSAVVDFVFVVAAPKPASATVRCKIVPEFSSSRPDDLQTVFQLDGRGYLPWSFTEGRNRQYHIVPLPPGEHRLRVQLRGPGTRFTGVRLEPATNHIANSTIKFEAKWGVVFKGENAAFDVEVRNALDSPVKYPVEFQIIDPDGKPILSEPAAVQLAANGAWHKHVEMSCPATGPLKVVVNIRTGHGTASASRQFGVLFRPAPGFKPDSYFLIDGQGNSDMLALFGAKWVRWELGWGAMEPRKGAFSWAAMDARVDAARRNSLYAIALMSHAPNWAIAWGGRVPAHRRGDRSPSPDHFDDYTNFCAKFAERYGDVVRAYNVWNEPWEGGSISGYGACGYHYRRLTKALWRGVKSVDQDLLVIGNDSAPNIEDNFACEKGFIEKYVDVGTIHTYTIPALMGQQYGPELMRQYGKPCWDTESWQHSHAVVKMHALGIAQGLTKVAPFNPRSVMGANGVTRAGCVYSALTHFIEDTKFHQEVNPHCLPWMFVFKGEQKNAAILFGDLGDDQGNPWSQIQVDGQMVIDDPRDELTLYDTFGNPREREPGRIVVPMNTSDFFLTTAGDVDAMCEALAKAKLSGLTPVEIAIPDFTRPLQQKPRLRVRIKNALNEALSGTVAVEHAEGLELVAQELPFRSLKPGATQELAYEIRSAKPNRANLYPVKVVVKTNCGEATHEEGLSVACCVRGSPFIDANPREWEAFGAVPVYLKGRRTGIDYWSGARYMWMEVPDFAESESNFAKVAAMYDSKYFYFAATVKYAGDYTRKSMKRPDAYEMMPAPAGYAYKKMRWSGGGIRIAFDCVPNDDTFYPPDHPYYRRWAFRNTDYEYSIYPTVERGPEVWRHRAPGVPWGTAYPFSPRAELDQDVVENARCAIHHDAEKGLWFFEAAIPLTELSQLRPAPGKTFNFSFLIPGIGHWSEARSACKLNALAFHPYWSNTYSVETAWGFTEPIEPD